MCCGICVSRNSDAGRQPHVVHVEQQLARQPQPLVDVEALVEIRVVDEALPADRGPRLLEVAAHHDDQVIRVALGEHLEPLGVLERRLRVVDRAGADDHHQSWIAPAERVGDGQPRVRHHVGSPLADRDLLEQDGGRNERPDLGDAEVVCPSKHDGDTISQLSLQSHLSAAEETFCGIKIVSPCDVARCAMSRLAPQLLHCAADGSRKNGQRENVSPLTIRCEQRMSAPPVLSWPGRSGSARTATERNF